MIVQPHQFYAYQDTLYDENTGKALLQKSGRTYKQIYFLNSHKRKHRYR